MTDEIIVSKSALEAAFKTVSQCKTADYCEGFNDAIKEILNNAQVVNSEPAPDTAPKAEYKKLLDAFKSTRNTLEFANELGGAISDTIWHGDAQTLFDFMDSIIAEAEGK